MLSQRHNQADNLMSAIACSLTGKNRRNDVYVGFLAKMSAECLPFEINLNIYFYLKMACNPLPAWE